VTSTGRARGRSSPTGPSVRPRTSKGSLFLVAAFNLDEALAHATQGSKACRGTIDVRPFQSKEFVEAFPKS
jgi:hypothetical protein